LLSSISFNFLLIMEDPYMNAKEITHFRKILMSERGEIIDRVIGLQATLALLSEPEKEMEEQAQKISASHALEGLGAAGKVKIDLIDLALRKMLLGDYGICETCEDEIALRRLEAVPWTRLCLECARDSEKMGGSLPEPEEAMPTASLPEDYAGLTDRQLLRAIYYRMERILGGEKSRIRIDVRKGVIYLEGGIEDDHERELILEMLTEQMGLGDIVHELSNEVPPWNGEEFGSDSIH
jgi:DnaK suppressor protein